MGYPKPKEPVRREASSITRFVKNNKLIVI